MEQIFFGIISWFYQPNWFELWSNLNTINAIKIWIINHSWFSFSFYDVLFQNMLNLEKIYIFSVIFFIWLLLDIIIAWIWMMLKKILKIKWIFIKNEKLFLIYFRFIPVLWFFGVLIWILKKDLILKKALISILIWNVYFTLFSIFFVFLVGFFT